MVLRRRYGEEEGKLKMTKVQEKFRLFHAPAMETM